MPFEMKPTAEQTAAYRRRLAEHVELTEWLAAWEKVYGKPDNSDLLGDAPDNGGDMTKAIEEIAIKSNTGLTYKEMREKLHEMGFPRERLANYFYTAVNRLEEKNRIHIDENKLIWGIF